MVKDIVIIGAGGFGREVQWLIESINEKSGEWNILGYIDDCIPVGTEIDGYRVLGSCEDLFKYKDSLAVACAVGASQTRKKIIEYISANDNISFPNLIAPTVVASNRIAYGMGNIICAGNILTVDITIGNFNIINLDCTVGHDVRIESYVTLYPSANISGNVFLGAKAEVGTGCHVIQGISIGEEAILGAGSVVIRDIPDKCTAVGSPAKVIKQRN